MLENEVWVAHPEISTKLVDVGQLLYQLSKIDSPVDSPFKTGPLAVINQTIRLLNRTVHDPAIVTPVELANLYHSLYILSDALNSITERDA